MESRRQQKQMPLGCRFIPYDQWFLTHIEPTWKIKHIKQMILAKCFGLPFDPRKFIRDNTGARPPSPITFAPDESHRPVSPIQFASPQEVRKKKSAGGPGDGGELSSTVNSPVGTPEHAIDDEGDAAAGDEGYEEDDEWDDDDETSSPRVPSRKIVMGGRVEIGGRVELATPVPPLGSITSPVAEKPSRKFNPLSKLTGSSATASSSNKTSSNYTSSSVSQGSDFGLVEPKETKKEPEIHTQDYTLVRFSTGQILEEDFLVSWYNLLPNELVELHASSSPVSFEITLAMPQLLMDPTYRSSGTTQANNASSSRLQGVIPGTAFVSTGLTLTALPRHDPVAYAEPYWEGWVRALRVVWQSEMPQPSIGGGKGHFSYQDYGAGMTNFHNSMAGGLAVFVADPGLFPEKHHHHREGGRMKNKLEWRERWVVIRDGTINLCKTRYDLTPTHCLPLSTLLSLRDASHLINTTQSKSSKPSTTTRPRSKTLRSGDSERDRRSHRRSISQPRSSTSTAKEHRHRDDGRYGRAHPTPARGLTVDSPRRSEKPMQQPSGPYTAPAPAVEANHRRTEAELESRERQRERARERELARERDREQRQRQEKELEYLRRWDDIGISFKRKPKDKEKEKTVDKGKGREMDTKRGGGEGRGKDYDKERERLYNSKRSEPERSVHRLEKEQTRSHRGYGEDEKDREKEREREREREQRHVKEQHKRERDRSRENSPRNEKTFIPYTREAAEAAGMKIVCAKFKSSRAWENERERQKKSAQSAPRYTSTGPSLAGESTVANDSDVTERDRDRKDINLGKILAGDDVNNNHQHTQSQTSQTLLQNVAPRKTSLPVINLTSSKHSSQSLMLNSPATATNAVTLYTGGASSSAAPKFGISGLFGKDRNAAGEFPSDDPNNAKKEKEDRKREEKERKAREKEQKVLEKEKKAKEKAKKREETGDEEESMTAGGLGWKLGKKKSGKVKEEALADAGPFSDSAVPSSSMTLNENYANVGQSREQTPLSINTALDAGRSSAASSVDENEGDGTQPLQAPLVRVDEPTTPGTRVRPKLTLSPIPDSASRTKAEHSDSNSSSYSLSSPVFYHSTDSDKSLDDLEADANGPLANTRRAERKGYRYGGYHDKKQELKRKATSDTGHGPRPTLFGIFDTPEPSKPSAKGKERDRPETLSAMPSREQESRSHSRNRTDEKKRKDEERGEWIVLDMGTDHAFNSILRIFHRYFSQPLTSNFVPASMVAAAHTQSSTIVPQSPTSSHHPPSLKTDSNVNSPVQSHFWSSSTLVRGSDEASIVSEQSRLASLTVASSSNLRSAFEPAPTPEIEDDDMYADPPRPPQSSQPSREKPQHPPILVNVKASSKTQKTPSLVPALPYPEWRRELVLRARRHGMRDASRPLDLALHGWGRDFEEMDLSGLAFRLQRQKEEEQRENIQNSFSLYGYDDPAYVLDNGGVEDDGNDGDAEQEDEEAEQHVPVARLGGDSGRRMSQVSHVSTIKAAEMNAAAAASVRSNQSIIESAGTFDENDEREHGSDEEEQWEDAESVVGYKDDEYQPSYGYGHEDEEDAIALGVDSMLDDSDEEDESETEWVAWITDLPRQIEARQQQKEMEEKRKKEEEEQKRQDALRKQGYGPGEKPLSPMIFSNPFTEQQQAPPLDVEDLDLNSPYVTLVPKTQEEERRQYVASRRKLEPTTAMTKMTPLPPTSAADPLDVSVQSVQQHGVSVTSIKSTFNPEVHVEAQTYTGGQQQTHLNRFTSRTVSTLSSHSSSESLGYARPSTSFTGGDVPSTSFATPSNAIQYLQMIPLSPVGSDPLDDDADRDRYTASSSTTPPSASYSTAGKYPLQSHRRAHSRSVSGSDVVQPRLHHSLSMPLGPGSPAPLVRAHGSSVPSSPPHSPTISTTTPKTITKKAIQPVSMPILTQAQINEIESETAERMQQQHRVGGFQPNAMSSSSSSFIPKPIPIPMPRRSSSAGYSGSGSPPSSAGVAMNLSASLGSGGVGGSGTGGGSPSLSRSASLLVKPHHPSGGVVNERGERERGVLKKKPSDLGKEREREGDVSPSRVKQRPKLSLPLPGLGGGSSASASSSPAVVATAPQYSANTPEVHSPTGGGGKMASAKALLRRVRSGSSLRMDSHLEEADSDYVYMDPNSPPIPLSPTTTRREGREVSPPPARRKIGPMDRFVRGLDSALEFVEGR